MNNLKVKTAEQEQAANESLRQQALLNDLVFENEYCYIHEALNNYIRIDKVTGQSTVQKEYFDKNKILRMHPSFNPC